ncbi:DUF423 domain-containing protein [Peijinzhouia sedimentorum]
MNETSKPISFVSIGCVMIAIGVALGAFGTHGLEEMLTRTGRVDTFETAVKYHFYNSLGIILIGVMCKMHPGAFKRSGWLILIGTIIFSGSLYFLCFTGITILGAVTPIGGVLLIIGWLFAAKDAFKNF